MDIDMTNLTEAYDQVHKVKEVVKEDLVPANQTGIDTVDTDRLTQTLVTPIQAFISKFVHEGKEEAVAEVLEGLIAWLEGEYDTAKGTIPRHNDVADQYMKTGHDVLGRGPDYMQAMQASDRK